MDCCGFRDNASASFSVRLPHHREGGAIFIEKASRKAKPITKSFVLKLFGIIKNLTRRSPAFVRNPTGVLLPNAFLLFRFKYKNFIWHDRLINLVDITTSLKSEEDNV